LCCETAVEAADVDTEEAADVDTEELLDADDVGDVDDSDEEELLVEEPDGEATFSSSCTFDVLLPK